jgi:hypothetical protein
MVRNQLSQPTGNLSRPPAKGRNTVTKDRADFILKCQKFVEAMMQAMDDAAAIKKAQSSFEGHSFDYFHRREIEAAERSAEQAGVILAELIAPPKGEGE